MKDIVEKMKQLFSDGRPSVLATIVRQAGPAPRGIGARCLVLEDGSLVGTIGGGVLEARTVATAEEVLESRRPRLLHFTLKGEDVADTDMLCGGEEDVFLEPVLPGSIAHMSVFEAALKVRNRGGAGMMATVLDPEHWLFDQVPKAFLDRAGGKTGSLLGSEEIENALREKMDDVLRPGLPAIVGIRDDAGNRIDIFVEPVVSTPVLYVFGGGHVSRQIVPLAAGVGFQVVVTDDREDFADPARFPDAEHVKCAPFDRVMETLSVDESSYLVIVTRGHMHDKTVLAQALRTPARYIGMIGSDRKRKVIYERLLEEGFSREDLSRVHSPIGLEIGAETPEEIAVSIVAELIRVRAG